MTKEEINQKTSICFLLNPNIPEEEKFLVIQKVMSAKATIVPKAALCNIIIYIMKQNAELKDKLKELLRKFLDAKSIEETCVAESEAEQFLNSEVEQ